MVFVRILRFDFLKYKVHTQVQYFSMISIYQVSEISAHQPNIVWDMKIPEAEHIGIGPWISKYRVRHVKGHCYNSQQK